MEEYLLAPSKVKDSQFTLVAAHIFGVPFAYDTEIKSFVAQAKPQSPNSQELQEASSQELQDTLFQQEEDKWFSDLLTGVYASTHALAEEEPPGYLPLGLLVVHFGQFLSRKLNATYKCHPQRTVAKNTNPGQNPSTDVAIVLRALTGDTYISKVLYEYKPRVHHLLAMVDIKHLVELLLQCYYVLKFEQQSSILGDLTSWHYINLTVVELANYFARQGN